MSLEMQSINRCFVSCLLLNRASGDLFVQIPLLLRVNGMSSSRFQPKAGVFSSF